MHDKIDFPLEEKRIKLDEIFKNATKTNWDFYFIDT